MDPVKTTVLCVAATCAAIFLFPATAEESASTGSKEAFLKLCATCHRPETVVVGRRTRSQWEDTLEKMIAKGAKGTDDELMQTLDYLILNYGRVNMNNATASEIVEIVGLPREQAEAIVKHRRANGRFEDFEGLMKVPGVDTKQLEKMRDAISF